MTATATATTLNRRGGKRPPPARPTKKTLTASSVTEAVSWLERFALIDTAAAAEHLREVLGDINLLWLYAEYFPAEYAASKAAFFPSAEDYAYFRECNGEDGKPHSAREHEFFDLVDSRLFPLAYWWRDIEQRLDFIPTCSEIGDWYEDEPDNYRPSLKLAGALLSQGAWETPEGVLKDMGLLRQGRLPEPIAPNQIDWDALLRACEEQPEPLRHFFHAVEVMDHSTGVVFIDHDCQCGDCYRFEWTKENIDALIEENKRGQAIFAKVHALDTWIEGSPTERVAEIVRLWNRALKPKPAAAKRKRKDRPA